MESVGARLRAARLSRGMTVDEVAQITKLPKASLELLENDSYNALPALVFVRGFVRSYAKTVGIDGDELVRRLPNHSGQGPEPMMEREAHFARIIGDGFQPERRFQPTQALMLLAAIVMLLVAWSIGGGQTTAPANDGSTETQRVEKGSKSTSPFTANRDR